MARKQASTVLSCQVVSANHPARNRFSNLNGLAAGTYVRALQAAQWIVLESKGKGHQPF